MCGIFGAFNFHSEPVNPEIIKKMSGSIRHRGPDADGFFSNPRALLGNRRLSILDLSSASNQPIYSHDKKTVVIQNGEIYNYIELRDELVREGVHFRTTGDTEVLLHAFKTWGPGFVTRLNGMFAIAIYDGDAEHLYLYRDRLGVKPLYISGEPGEGRIWFGSEIKTILANGLDYAPNLSAIASYFALNYIPAPDTAFQGIEHVPPGHMITISPDGMTAARYWDLAATQPDSGITETEAAEHFLALLDNATKLRMRSDAAYGAFLSGGLDSSTVVGFMSQHSKVPVHTFSIGFNDPRFDESEYAEMAAKRFGTRHQSKIAEHDIARHWPHFIYHCDQPHGDVSFIPMGIVSELAARNVKMVLTGDGGDELFAGYDKYLDMFPGGGIDHLGAGWEHDFVRASGLLLNDEPQRLLRGALKDAFFDGDPYHKLSDEILRVPHQDPVNRVLFAETTVLLPGNNLVKPDRMAMAHSLEVRSPFLDYRMAEFAFQIPGHMKLQDGETKAIFKTAVAPMLGQDLTYRPKQMFTVPIGEWFRQALTGYCRDVLLSGTLGERGLLNMKFAEQMLQRHIAGTHNYTRQLRAMISLELWFRIFFDGDDSLLVSQSSISS